jgi:hypothetical protein
MTSKALVTTTPNTVLGVLQAARNLIKKPQNWTKYAFARRSSRGVQVSWTDPEAKCFCGLGAIRKASEGNYGLDEKATNLLCEAIEGGPFSVFNDADTTTHKDVLLAFDTAIQLAGGPPR